MLQICRNGFPTGAMTAAALALGIASPVGAVELSFAAGVVGSWFDDFKAAVKPWEESTGNTVKLVPMPASTSDQFAQYRLWLAAGNSDVDLYMTDVIWAPQLAEQFVDLKEAAGPLLDEHFPSVIASQTVDDRVVALPLYTDAPALYYRRDLLDKYGEKVPETWQELTATAQKIQEGERAEGNSNFWGFVWQGNAYEGLTCNALEWVKSSGGGQIVEPDGTISIFNEDAIAAVELAASWVGTISPPGVLAYQEEEARGVWQTGNAAFMRNWPYAYALSSAEDSAVKGKFDAAPLPHGEGGESAATLGGWNVAVSKFSQHQEEAISLATYLASAEGQKALTMRAAYLPTVVALYDDAEIGAKYPIVPNWKEVFEHAVPRPSAPTKKNYNEVSAKFWSAVHDTLAGDGTAEENLEILEIDLDDLKGGDW